MQPQNNTFLVLAKAHILFTCWFYLLINSINNYYIYQLYYFAFWSLGLSSLWPRSLALSAVFFSPPSALSGCALCHRQLCSLSGCALVTATVLSLAVLLSPPLVCLSLWSCHSGLSLPLCRVYLSPPRVCILRQIRRSVIPRLYVQ